MSLNILYAKHVVGMRDGGTYLPYVCYILISKHVPFCFILTHFVVCISFVLCDYPEWIKGDDICS